MASNLTEILSISSAIIGGLVAAAQATFLARQNRAASEEVQRLAKDAENAVLKSNDINRLGEYLYDNIGPTRIANYVSNSAVRDRVTQALDGILTFLGTEDIEVTPEESEVVEQQAQQPEVVEALERSQPEAIRESSEMTKAIEEITFGEVWNGLARMRRYIELQLRELNPDLPEDRTRSAGQILSELERSGRISKNSANQLRYAINVANAGIHGAQIDVGQAQEAWEAAVRGMALMPTGMSEG